MAAVTALCILIATLLVLHACATSIRDAEELHALSVRVHSVRNDYLDNLRGGSVEIVGESIAEVEPIASIGHGQDAETPDAAEPQEETAQAA
ncbi:MAG: hypothetical protein AAF937_02600 [Planctomycetota bacterium]